MRRVVVTGVGLVSPLGCGSELAWSRLLAACSGLAALPKWATALPARVAGIVPTKADDPDGGFDPDLVVAPKDQRRMDRFILFALVATAEAVAHPASEAFRQSSRQFAPPISAGSGASRPSRCRPFSQISRPVIFPSATASRVPSARRLPLAPRACRRSAMPHASFEPAKRMLRFAVARKPASIS